MKLMRVFTYYQCPYCHYQSNALQPFDPARSEVHGIVFSCPKCKKQMKLTKKIVDLMIKGCTENAEEDLAIAKEFEQIENEVEVETEK